MSSIFSILKDSTKKVVSSNSLAVGQVYVRNLDDAITLYDSNYNASASYNSYNTYYLGSGIAFYIEILGLGSDYLRVNLAASADITRDSLVYKSSGKTSSLSTSSSGKLTANLKHEIKLSKSMFQELIVKGNIISGSIPSTLKSAGSLPLTGGTLFFQTKKTLRIAVDGSLQNVVFNSNAKYVIVGFTSDNYVVQLYNKNIVINSGTYTATNTQYSLPKSTIDSYINDGTIWVSEPVFSKSNTTTSSNGKFAKIALVGGAILIGYLIFRKKD